ncbi:hypothetical protein RDI58_011986 [Solanum bulbocastanum]|uniref:F-box domain-containing protein n=1 Tax=Solanum bulbocastanum TaxID=147425 RepID=A0AAN8TS56_SOLBU
MDDYVANFPEDIVNEILLRCPVKSLLRFKCACKNWYALIKTSKFIQQHLKKNRSPLQFLIYNTADVLDDSCPMSLISEENSQTFLVGLGINWSNIRNVAMIIGGCKHPIVIVVEMDRILRPGVSGIIRDKVEILDPLKKLLRSLHWEIRMTFAKDKEAILCAQKTMWRP